MAKQTKEESSGVTHKSLAGAVIAVMKEVKGMEKNSRVGGNSPIAYDGTKDQDVKEIFNKVMADNGLVILPIEVAEKTRIDRWEEEKTWNGKTEMKQKQAVFTKVNTRYKLIHADSGESEILAGYGHGVDSQDKGAGKATTYALKNCLLYTFLTPVGKIDDTDNTHSQDHQAPGAKQPQNQQQQTTPPAQKPAEKKKPTLEQRVKKTVEGINAVTELPKLAEAWKKLPKDVKTHADVVAAKEAKKSELTPKQ